MSPSIKSYLREQILSLFPKLQEQNAQINDVFALPLAQLGDWHAAQRAATKPWTRDSLYAWRAKQIAVQHRYGEAVLVAQHILHPATRADSLLLIARLALEKGDVLAVRSPLLAAMRAMEKSPHSAQLAYAAWLWGQSGDMSAARRVLWQKAYPRALRENEDQRKDEENQLAKLSLARAGKPQSQSDMVKPRVSVRRLQRTEHEQLVFDFASQLGLVSDIVERTTHSNLSGLSWILARVNNRSDFELLRHWLEDSPPAAPHDLLTLALAAARVGMTSEAQQLRDKALLQVQGLPLEPYGERVNALAVNMMVAIELGERNELNQSLGELQKAFPATGVPTGPTGSEDISLLASVWHLSTLGEAFSDSVARLNVDDTTLENAALKILSSPASSTQLIGLKLLAQIYSHRPQNNPVRIARLQQIAEATVRNIQDLVQQFEEKTRKQQSVSWASQPTEIAKILHDVQPGLEQHIVKMLVTKTPLPFQTWNMSQLYQNGFPEAARQAFDPAKALRQAESIQVALRHERDPKKQMALQLKQLSVHWEDVAAAQARYDAPEAPRRWYGAIPDDVTRLRVLRAWIDALSPEVELKPPFVRRMQGSVSYRVGGSAGSSVG